MNPTTAFLLITFNIHTQALNIHHPHQNFNSRYNDVIINTALSSTAAIDQQRSNNDNNVQSWDIDQREELDYITHALLQQPPRDENGYNYHNNHPDNANQMMIHHSNENDETMNHNVPINHQRQFRDNSQHQSMNNNNRHDNSRSNDLSQRTHSNNVRVMTGAQRRSTWESYAMPGTPPRSIHSINDGGVIGSPRGRGDWEYTSSGPATSVTMNDEEQDGGYLNNEVNKYQHVGFNGDGTSDNTMRVGQRSYNLGNTVGFGSVDHHAAYNGERIHGNSRRADPRKYNMGNTIGFGSPNHHNRNIASSVLDRTVMTGAQRRATFQNIHTYDPSITDSTNFHYLSEENEHQDSSFETYTHQDVVDASDDLPNIESSDVGQERYIGGAEFISSFTNTQQHNTDETLDGKEHADTNGFQPLPTAPDVQEVSYQQENSNDVEKTGNFIPLGASVNDAITPSFKGSEGTSYSMNRGLKGSGIFGLKGKEKQSKSSPFANGMNVGAAAGPFAKSSTQSFKAASAPRFNAFKSPPVSRNINGIGGIGGGMKKGPLGIGLKGKEQGKSVFSSGTKSGPSPFAKPSSTTFKGIKQTSFPVNGMGGSGLGMLKGLDNAGLKEKFSRGGLFGKKSSSSIQGSNTNSPSVFERKGSAPVNSGFGSEMKSPGSLGFGLKGKEQSEMKSGAGPFAKTSNAPKFKGSESSSMPMNGFQKNTAGLKVKGIEAGKGVLGNIKGFGSANGSGSTQIQDVYGSIAPSDNVGWHEGDCNLNPVGLRSSPPKTFKPFVPPVQAQPQAQEEDEVPNQDLASFLQSPSNNIKRKAKDVADSLSALSSPPIFYNDFEETHEELTYEDENKDSRYLNFAVSGGAVQEMPSVDDVPMHTPARRSLPPYLSLVPILGKGLGVVTNKPFKIGEFVGNYEGEIMEEDVKGMCHFVS